MRLGLKSIKWVVIPLGAQEVLRNQPGNINKTKRQTERWEFTVKISFLKILRSPIITIDN